MVDEITQFEMILSVEKISEYFLIPVLEQLLETFPFIIKGFHSDNGSEYINKPVEKLLNKLLIKMTKSRSRQTMIMHWLKVKMQPSLERYLVILISHKKWAKRINEFNINYLYPYINYHRPCFFPEIIIDDKGKQRKQYRYENMMTPYDKLNHCLIVRNI